MKSRARRPLTKPIGSTPDVDQEVSPVPGPARTRTSRPRRARSASDPAAPDPATRRRAEPPTDHGAAGFAAEGAPAVDARSAEGREHLLLGSPREVITRLIPGDPLDVRDAVADLLRESCVFLDADRVHLVALARIARAAPKRTGLAASAAARTDLATWVRGEVAGAIADLLRDELEGHPVDGGAAFEQFSRPLGLDPSSVRRGCAAFNRLPVADRRAFCALVLRGVGLEAFAREVGATPSEVGRRARRGLDAVLHANHPDLPPPVRTPASGSKETPR